METPSLFFNYFLSVVIACAGAESEGDPCLARPKERYYWTKHNCCGLTAAYIISHQRGCGDGLTALAKKRAVGPSGTSMNELAKYFEDLGLSSRGVRCNAVDLHKLLFENPELRAVILVSGNHWLAATAPQRGECEVFDYPKWQTMSVADLNGAFAGDALIVGSQEAMTRALASSSQFRLVSAVAGAAACGLALGCVYLKKRGWFRLQSR